jgi:hypothetical protein
MPSVKRIVCLANSVKKGGRCIAGKRWADGKEADWIRPVSERPYEEVSPEEYKFQDGGEPQLLDIVKVPLLKRKPNGPQKENWLLDPEFWWEKAGTISWSDLGDLVDAAEPLWIDGWHSSNGTNDRIPLHIVEDVHTSLRFIKVRQLRLNVTGYNVRGLFRHSRADYALVVTDPLYRDHYKRMADGDYDLGDAYLTISLGEEFKGARYKLIAAILRRKGPGQ